MNLGLEEMRGHIGQNKIKVMCTARAISGQNQQITNKTNDGGFLGTMYGTKKTLVSSMKLNQIMGTFM